MEPDEGNKQGKEEHILLFLHLEAEEPWVAELDASSPAFLDFLGAPFLLIKHFSESFEEMNRKEVKKEVLDFFI